MSDPSSPSRYRLEQKIGEGSKGEVWRARLLTLDRDVALKVLTARGPEADELFVREAQITAQLSHPGMPVISDMDVLPDGRPFVAMELIRGRTVADYLTERETDPLFGTRMLQLFEEVCRAVGYAHFCGVLHCNLQPALVMIGEFGVVKVLEWGLAKLLPGGSIRNARPDAGEATTRDANPAYMPPEQAAGDVEAITPRSDVFALGAILCHLLTGRPPYVAPDLTSLRRMAVHAELADAFRRLDASRAAKELVEFCKRCLSADPAGRPATAAEVACAVSVFRSRGSRGFLGWWRKILGGTSV